MPSIKRSLSASPSEPSTPPAYASDSDYSSAPSSAKQSKNTPKSGGKKKTKGSIGGSPSKRVRVNWAPEEDAIILDLLKDIAKEHLWAKIKEYGRLVSRGSNGIKVHFESMMTKIIKPQGSALGSRGGHRG